MIDTVLKSLSDRNRLRIVAALFEVEELCGCQLTELLQVSGATASKHVSILVKAGIVESRKEGRWVYYRIVDTNSNITPLIDWVKGALKNDSEIVHDIKKVKSIIAVEPEELCRRQRGVGCCPV